MLASRVRRANLGKASGGINACLALVPSWAPQRRPGPGRPWPQAKASARSNCPPPRQAAPECRWAHTAPRQSVQCKCWDAGLDRSISTPWQLHNLWRNFPEAWNMCAKRRPEFAFHPTGHSSSHHRPRRQQSSHSWMHECSDVLHGGGGPLRVRCPTNSVPIADAHQRTKKRKERPKPDSSTRDHGQGNGVEACELRQRVGKRSFFFNNMKAHSESSLVAGCARLYT